MGPADPDETVRVTIALRRRPDGPPVPDFEYFRLTSPRKRPRLSEEDFAARYGADPADVERVVEFARANELTVEQTNYSRRTVVVTGSVAQMSRAFAVRLDRYEHRVARARGREPEPETYRGRDGFIYVPRELGEVIIGVFGLDNRNITKRATAGDPPNTSTLTVPQIAGLYQFPTNSAAGQNIAIFSEAGYEPSDITEYYNHLPASYTSIYGPPKVTPVTVDADNGTPDVETTQDICIAFSAAPGAKIYVYFTTYDQVGWFDLIHRVVHPDPGDAICSVLTASYFVSYGDDAAALQEQGITLSWIYAVHAALEDAAIQGVTFCIGSGDDGVDTTAQSGSSDGKQHVIYPASDPYALACGGTTVGNVTAGSFDEWVWNDTAQINGAGGFTFYGATGGGVSNLFPKPSYQQNANVPLSLNGGQPGRGVPDVAFNASWNSGYYPIYCVNAAASDYPNPYNGNGTSASAPLCAGLIAVINAALDYDVGFLHPILYALGGSVCRDVNPYAINPPSGPVNNSPGNGNNVPGYPAGPGWDACTGWGSIVGTALLDALQQGAEKACYVILEWETFVEQGISEMLSTSTGASFPDAFYVVADGFTAADLGIGSTAPVQPAVALLPSVPSGMRITSVGPAIPDPTVPLRYMFACGLAFTDVTGFPAASDAVETITVTASVTGKVTADTASGSAPITLTTQSAPFMVPGPVTWLSNDIRVFQIEASAIPAWLEELNNDLETLQEQGQYVTLANLNDTGNPVTDATSFIQQVIQGFNQLAATDPPPDHPFDSIPASEDASQLDLAQTDGATNNPVYNFAVARVRYQDAAVDAENVRVFFRTFPAMAISTAYDQSTTYRRWSDGVEFGDTISLLGGQYDPSLGQQLETVPFFAEPRVDATKVSMDTQTDAPNVQTLVHQGQGSYAYYGCWLDINQPAQLLYPAAPTTDGPFTGALESILQLLGSQHQCLTAEIAFDPVPIPNGATPGSSPMLGQRNLSLGNVATSPSGIGQAGSGPGGAGPGGAARMTAHPFELGTTADAAGTPPDELVMDWRAMPAGTTATLYLPAASAASIVLQAIELYGRSKLANVDQHTLRFPAEGIVSIPLPGMAGAHIAGLLSVQLPPGNLDSQPHTAVVKQVTSGAAGAREAGAADGKGRTWRRVTGAFQLQISALPAAAMLPAEERLLSILRWIDRNVPRESRWAPVLARYLRQIAARVRALGGNPAQVQPSPTGQWQKHSPAPGGGKSGGRPGRHRDDRDTGKILAIRYDRFGDFDGFLLETLGGSERSFGARGAELERLVSRAWSEHIPVTVLTDPGEPNRPTAVLLWR